MKQRTVSSLFAIAITTSLFVFGEIIFKLGVGVIAIMGLKEILDIKESKKNIPLFMKIITYLSLVLLLYGTTLEVSHKIIVSLFLIFMIPNIIYHDINKYNVNDTFFLLGSVLFLGFAFNIINILKDINANLVIYLILITAITDAYAYIVGVLIGKHKLLEVISPKKTLEGAIGGTLVGVFVASVFYINVIDSNISLVKIILLTLFLSILGQIGDLFFSFIKRYFNKKNFSNIMPGHGGILDRLDSLIFAVLGFILFL
ncbi:MAG: CDP-archaeol synthase [Bacilli bacterium]